MYYQVMDLLYIHSRSPVARFSNSSYAQDTMGICNVNYHYPTIRPKLTPDVFCKLGLEEQRSGSPFSLCP